MTRWHLFIRTIARIKSIEIPFAKEDEYILSKYDLQNLRTRYPKNNLIPEDISVAVGKAYKYINRTKKYKDIHYLQESGLGKKIQKAVDHDKDFIENFCKSIYDTCLELEENGPEIDLDKDADQVKVKKQYLKKTKSEDKKVTDLGYACAERIKRYGLDTELPGDW